MIYTRLLYLIPFIASKTRIEGEESNLITDVKRNSIISNLSGKNDEKDKEPSKSSGRADPTRSTKTNSVSTKDSKSGATKTASASNTSTKDSKLDDSKIEKSNTKIELSEKVAKEDKSGSTSKPSESGSSGKKEKDSQDSTSKPSKSSSSGKKEEDGQGSTSNSSKDSKKSKLVDSETYNFSVEEPLKISRLIESENPSTQNHKSGLTDNLFEFASKLDSTDEKTKDTNILSNLASPIFGNLNEGSHHGSSKDKTNLA